MELTEEQKLFNEKWADKLITTLLNKKNAGWLNKREVVNTDTEAGIEQEITAAINEEVPLQHIDPNEDMKLTAQ